MGMGMGRDSDDSAYKAGVMSVAGPEEEYFNTG